MKHACHFAPGACPRTQEIERVQTLEGALPIGAALLADAVAHSIPGLSVLLTLLSEPIVGAAGWC